MQHSREKSRQQARVLVDRLSQHTGQTGLSGAAAAFQDMEACVIENLGLDEDSNQFAEEVFEEYEQMRAEVERSACRADREGW